MAQGFCGMALSFLAYNIGIFSRKNQRRDAKEQAGSIPIEVLTL